MNSSKPRSLTIKITHAGHYSGEYPHKVALGEKQDLDEWEHMMRSVGKLDAVVALGHFTFGKDDPEEGRFHTKSVRYVRDRKV